MTRSQLLAWFYRRGKGARYSVLLENFGTRADAALDGLIELGMVFEYTQQKSGAKKYRMFKVKARWSKNLELNSGQGGYRLGRFKIKDGGYFSATEEFARTAEETRSSTLPKNGTVVSTAHT